MVAPARRAIALTVALLAWPAARASAQAISVTAAGTVLQIRAPALAFLKGETLARLKDGRSVRLELAATVLAAPGKSPVAAARRIFALSYDLWEERFAVTTVDPPSRSASHLAAAAAEAWCVDQLGIPLGAIARDVPFWIRLEYRTLDADDSTDPAGAGFTLQALIDILSRRRTIEAPPRAIEGGPFRLPSRGSPVAR